MDEKMYWLGFSLCSGIGPVKFKTLLTHFGSAEKAWNATERELQESGVGKSAAGLIVDFKKTFSPVVYAEKLQKAQVTYVTLVESTYPKLLSAIDRPPFVLYIKGNAAIVLQNDFSKVAVVGTRKVTEYGRQVTEFLTEALSQSGCIIVSGLAMGVDAIAHAATLRAGGKTIAVLGSGVDYCTPKENEGLYNSILEKDGAIVSEVPLGSIPNKGSFPSRNRIIAGLSQGVLVTEGAEDSGSLITAGDAFKNNRKVFAVPGPITSSVSRGPIALINKGAKMVMVAEDILTELHMKRTNPPSLMLRSHAAKGFADGARAKGDTDEEQKIIDVLENENLHFDELVKQTGLGSSHLGTVLSLMEMKGIVKNLDSGMFGLEN